MTNDKIPRRKCQKCGILYPPLPPDHTGGYRLLMVYWTCENCKANV